MMTTQEQLESHAALIRHEMLLRFGKMSKEQRVRWAAHVAGLKDEEVVDAELRQEGRELVLKLVRLVEFISFTVTVDKPVPRMPIG
jgi:hypothetical protein